MAEIVRAGIISVDEGQTDAAHALGMTRLQTLRRIVLPQAMRVVIPPTGNETISMLKTTSLVSVIAYTELLYAVQLIYAANYQQVPLLIVAMHLVPRSLTTAARRSGSTSSNAASVAGLARMSAARLVRIEGVQQALRRAARCSAASRSRSHEREVVCLLGPSGSGKSTLLRCINHLEKIDAGRLWVDGELVGYRQVGDTLHELREREVARKRAEIGMVFQRFNLFPHMTALENVIEAPVCVRAPARARTPSRAGASCSTGSGSATSSTPTRRSSRAASSSAWRSRGRWRWSRS